MKSAKEKQIRWQPELATSIIYWSLTLGIFFVSLIFTLEKTHIYWLSLVLFCLFAFFVWLGVQRTIRWLDVDSFLIHPILKRNRKIIHASQLEQVLVGPHGISLAFCRGEKLVLLMTKKNKVRFLAKLRQNPQLKAKITSSSSIEHFFE